MSDSVSRSLDLDLRFHSYQRAPKYLSCWVKQRHSVLLQDHHHKNMALILSINPPAAYTCANWLSDSSIWHPITYNTADRPKTGLILYNQSSSNLFKSGSVLPYVKLYLTQQCEVWDHFTHFTHLSHFCQDGKHLEGEALKPETKISFSFSLSCTLVSFFVLSVSCSWVILCLHTSCVLKPCKTDTDIL